MSCRFLAAVFLMGLVACSSSEGDPQLDSDVDQITDDDLADDDGDDSDIAGDSDRGDFDGGPGIVCGAATCAEGQVCAGGSTCCTPQTLDEACDGRCDSQSASCGTVVDCGTSHCLGTCVDHDCVCPPVGAICAADCQTHPAQGARQVYDPCRKAAVTCTPCAGGGG